MSWTKFDVVFFPLVGKDRDVSMDIHLSGTIFFCDDKRRGKVVNGPFTTTCISPLSFSRFQCTCRNIGSPVEQDHIVELFSFICLYGT